jgi:PAS domain S-box-containing protein
MGEHISHREHALVLDLYDSKIGAFAVDAERRVVAWNTAAEALLGFRADETVGRRCSDVLRACTLEKRDDVQPICGNCPLAGVPLHSHAGVFEVQVSTRDGGSRWISVGTLEAETLAGERRVAHFFRDSDHSGPGLPGLIE